MKCEKMMMIFLDHKMQMSRLSTKIVWSLQKMKLECMVGRRKKKKHILSRLLWQEIPIRVGYTLSITHITHTPCVSLCRNIDNSTLATFVQTFVKLISLLLSSQTMNMKCVFVQLVFGQWVARQLQLPHKRERE